MLLKPIQSNTLHGVSGFDDRTGMSSNLSAQFLEVLLSLSDEFRIL